MNDYFNTRLYNKPGVSQMFNFQTSIVFLTVQRICIKRKSAYTCTLVSLKPIKLNHLCRGWHVCLFIKITLSPTYGRYIEGISDIKPPLPHEIPTP